MSMLTVIRPQDMFTFPDLKELWSFRELFYIFVWRDIKVRYKQTTLGVIWVLLQPLVNMVIFTVLFGNLAKVPSGDLPYSLFVFIGLVFWTLFSSAVSFCNDSLLNNENIIKRIYFPRIILPLAAVITTCVDFCISLLLLFGFALLLGYVPHWNIVYILPFCIFLTLITTVGLGLFLSSLNVKYRDVRYALPFFIQILFYFTPVIYPLSIVSSRNKALLALNPLATVIELMRSAYAQTSRIDASLIGISLLSAFFLLSFGFWHFRKTERFFADIV
jgi:lipopolysaccharide transport system permease protein